MAGKYNSCCSNSLCTGCKRVPKIPSGLSGHETGCAKHSCDLPGYFSHIAEAEA